ncbi:hypothetical protein EWM64_g3053 [Hericium alpestre]|uniref:Uncharacterized protein n=1 Tax=Hericium alpestre TaxID=135208 RepID=A0A4Z0A1K5_9AGAM|nr:hypothetical protein EWM64_g3053 [Hericium alpestre]
MPLLHPEPRHLETVETVRKQRIAYAMRHHVAEEDHGDADDESGSVEDSVWSMASSPGSLPGMPAGCERLPRMPGSYASPEVNSSPSFTWSALGLEDMVPQSMHAPPFPSDRLPDLWLNIPTPMFPTPQSPTTSALGLQGVPPLPVFSIDEFELEAAGKSEWFE